MKKARKLIAATTADILVITQDDIMFEKDTIQAIAELFENNPSVTMVGIRILPLRPETWFEMTMTSMVRLVDKIAQFWNKGDNYLAASGRCLAFRTNHIKRFHIPEVVNGDMYLYLENARLGGKFMRSEKAKVYIRCPARLGDQYGPSNRFQYSQQEMETYFSVDMKKLYKIPRLAIIRGVITEFLYHPVAFVGYLIIFLITRIYRIPAKDVMKTVWDADASTKKVVVD